MFRLEEPELDALCRLVVQPTDQWDLLTRGVARWHKRGSTSCDADQADAQLYPFTMVPKRGHRTTVVGASILVDYLEALRNNTALSNRRGS